MRTKASLEKDNSPLCKAHQASRGATQSQHKAQVPTLQSLSTTTLHTTSCLCYTGMLYTRVCSYQGFRSTDLMAIRSRNVGLGSAFPSAVPLDSCGSSFDLSSVSGLKSGICTLHAISRKHRTVKLQLKIRNCELQLQQRIGGSSRAYQVIPTRLPFKAATFTDP